MQDSLFESSFEFPTQEFVNSFGETVTEEVNIFPDASLRESGVVSNQNFLELSTGTQTFAKRTGGVDEQEFDVEDDGYLRPVSEYNRKQSFVTMNRGTLQPPAELQTERKDLYHGYNPITTRVPKDVTETERSKQEWVVYGAETNGGNAEIVEALNVSRERKELEVL